MNTVQVSLRASYIQGSTEHYVSRMEGDYMLGYRMIVNKDTKDNLTWSLTFDDDDSQYNKAEVEEIFSVTHEFVAVLSKLQQK